MRKKLKKSGSVEKRFREQLWISQVELADFLGVSKQLLNMVESGKRDLKPTVSIKFTFLSAAMNMPLPEADEKHYKISTLHDERERKLKKESKYVLIRLARKQERWENEYQKSKAALQNLNKWLHLIDDASSSPQKYHLQPADLTWLADQRKKAAVRLGKISDSDIILMEGKLRMLKEEIKMWEAIAQ